MIRLFAAVKLFIKYYIDTLDRIFTRSAFITTFNRSHAASAVIPASAKRINRLSERSFMQPSECSSIDVSRFLRMDYAKSRKLLASLPSTDSAMTRKKTSPSKPMEANHEVSSAQHEVRDQQLSTRTAIPRAIGLRASIAREMKKVPGDIISVIRGHLRKVIAGGLTAGGLTATTLGFTITPWDLVIAKQPAVEMVAVVSGIRPGTCKSKSASNIDEILSSKKYYTTQTQKWHLTPNNKGIFSGTKTYPNGSTEQLQGHYIERGGVVAIVDGKSEDQTAAYKLTYDRTSGYFVGTEILHDCEVDAVLVCPFVAGPASKETEMQNDERLRDIPCQESVDANILKRPRRNTITFGNNG